MPSGHHLVAFAITSFVIIVVPGPSVLFIVGRALAVGRREAVLTMVGNTVGAAVMLVAVALGLGALIAASAIALTVVKLAGAAYLIYLGVHAFRTRKSLVEALQGEVKPANTRRALRQGFLVGVTNAKTAVFFAAVLPQFVDKHAAPASLQILLLGLSGATLLLLDEPTDNLDLVSAEALEEGLEGFEGTVIAVTHDRWFARGFDRFLVFGSDGTVYESDEPVWDERRVVRNR